MQEKIKVLVVDGIYPPAYTGSGLRAHRTYKRLSASYPVEYAVLTTTSGDFKPGPDEYDRVRIYRTRSNRSFISQMIQVYRLFKKYELYRYDIVHGFGDSLVVLAAGLMAKYHGAKLIHELTVLAPETRKPLVRVIKDALNFFRFGYAKKIIYKKADLLIALNEYIKQHYIRRGIAEQNIWKRPNPVDTTKFYMPGTNEKMAIRKNLGIPEDKIVVLLVGKFEPRKNQRFAIEVIRSLPEYYYLIMVGPKDESVVWYFDEIIHEIQMNGINKRADIYQGYHKDVEKYFKASDVLWIPSYSEGTPNVMLEAMCCGLPVIVNKALDLGEYIINGKNGLEENLVLEEFRSATLSLEKNRYDMRSRKEISTSARGIMDAKYIDGLLVSKLEKLIEN